MNVIRLLCGCRHPYLAFFTMNVLVESSNPKAADAPDADIVFLYRLVPGMSDTKYHLQPQVCQLMRVHYCSASGNSSPGAI